MKELQNNFTTLEQSKRLLELGVPADSADCFYRNWDCLLEHPSTDTSKYIHVRKTRIEQEACYMYFAGNLPCWSVGRLIEICLKCSTLEQRQVLFFCNGDDDYYSLIDYVVNVLESGVMTNHIDFSKLEN